MEEHAVGFHFGSHLRNSCLQNTAQVSPGLRKPPVKPRTAFICFKDSKVAQINWTTDPDEILKYISKEWQKLSDNERAHWDEVSREDKVRYVQPVRKQ